MRKNSLEQLESRSYFSAVLDSSGIVQVTGTSGDDNINITTSIGRTRSLNFYVITDSSGSHPFGVDLVKGIVVNAGDGNDTLTVSAPFFNGRVTLNGQGGDDALTARGGSVHMDGGPGSDTFRSTSVDFAGIDESDLPGDLTVTDTTAISGSDTDTFQGYFGNLITGNGNNHITLSADERFERISTGAGNDYIACGSKSFIYAGDGDDTIVSSSGGEYLYAGSGHNQLISTASRIDEARSSWYTIVGGVLNIFGTNTADQITVKPHASGSSIDVTFDNDLAEFNSLAIKALFIRGGAGDDRVTIDSRVSIPATITGNTGNDTIYGGSGIDRIDGGDGDDWINGGAGNDVLDGDAGNDRLFGGAGSDHLDGGTGVNVLRGDDGRDRIVGHKTDDLHANIGDVIALI